MHAFLSPLTHWPPKKSLLLTWGVLDSRGATPFPHFEGFVGAGPGKLCQPFPALPNLLLLLLAVSHSFGPRGALGSCGPNSKLAPPCACPPTPSPPVCLCR